MKDILFLQEDFIFSYRVGGILIQDDKILLQKPKNDEYAIIGGHIKSMETTEDTLIREYREEIKADIEVDELIAVGEVFFPWGKYPCHQICLYYKVHLKDENSIPKKDMFQGYDDFGNERMDLDFYWVPLEELRKGVKVYPLELIPIILEGKNEAVHFVSKQL